MGHCTTSRITGWCAPASGFACPTNPSRYTEGEVRFPFRLAWNSTASYVGLLAASFSLALFVSYIFGPQINDYAYDSMFRAHRPPKPGQPEAVVLAIDELTLMDCGGIRGIRRPIAEALRSEEHTSELQSLR